MWEKAATAQFKVISWRVPNRQRIITKISWSAVS